MRFHDVRRVDETGSTNTDLLALARGGAPEGVVLVADVQTAGRGRRGRGFDAPSGASLLMSVLLRPPARVASLCTMVVGLAAVEALESVAGVQARLKWPNDVVWPGDGSAPDRKMAGILAEADWPARSQAAAGWSEPPPEERMVVVVGIGLNVDWPQPLPEELEAVAVAANHVAGRPVDRELVLPALLEALDRHYEVLVAPDGSGPRVITDRWRARSATLGRRVRLDLGADDVEGTAVDITDDGRLVLEHLEGDRQVYAVGDVVHLRPRS